MMVEDDFHRATLPLYEDGLVEAAEWSFDVGWGRELPKWLEDILDHHSRASSLFGHGVSYSVLDALDDSSRHVAWLQNFEIEMAERQYQHVSEHFGFMSGENFHFSSPMPVPLTDASVKVGQQRMLELAEIAQAPVGLENLAFAFGLEDVRNQGNFLDRLLAEVDGFLVLDLHNIYCQICNFEIGVNEILESYPLSRVRELHVSGGSWTELENDKVRRDTHDGDVPEEVFSLVNAAIPRCPNLEVVFMERLGGSLNDYEAVHFRQDYQRLHKAVHESWEAK